MAIEPAEDDATTTQQTVLRRHVHERVARTRSADARPVANGGHIVWNSTPGLLGPDIAPRFVANTRSASRSPSPVRRLGDAIAIRIKDIEVTSLATASGNDQPMEGRFNGDPYARPSAPGAEPNGRRPGSKASDRRRSGARTAAPTHPVHIYERLHDRVRRTTHGGADRPKGRLAACSTLPSRGHGWSAHRASVSSVRCGSSIAHSGLPESRHEPTKSLPAASINASLRVPACRRRGSR